MTGSWGVYKHQKNRDTATPYGRIVQSNRENFRVAIGETVYNGVICGKLRNNSRVSQDFPVTGDWVICELKGDIVVITEILQRETVISRKVAGITTEEQPLAANIGHVFIVMALDGGRNYSSRGLERYLTIAWNSGTLPCVILNKADLCDDPDILKSEAEIMAPGVDVLVCSAVTGEGIENIRARIKPGETAVLTGPSGAGKSAITNTLIGHEVRATRETRKSDKRGVHTTTNGCMYILPGGGLLIDSPGLREIQLWGDIEALDSAFAEISELAVNCRFRDCTHESEPHCAVHKALAEGLIDRERFENYRELRKELEFLEARRSERGKAELRSSQKKFGKMLKNFKKGKTVY